MQWFLVLLVLEWTGQGDEQVLEFFATKDECLVAVEALRAGTDLNAFHNRYSPAAENILACTPGKEWHHVDTVVDPDPYVR